MLVDTSVWIQWLRGRETPQTLMLDSLLDEADAWFAPVILQELLQGARNEANARRLRAEFADQPMLMPSVQTHLAAGDLYARCRWHGVTIRSPHDCLIATLAIEHQTMLLQDDRDFARIASMEPSLRLWCP